MVEERIKFNRVASKRMKQKINEPKTISNAFNDFFVDIGPKLAANIQHSGKNYFDYLKQQAKTCMYMKPIVAEEIVKIVGKFSPIKVLATMI